MFLTFLGAGINSFLKLSFHIPRPWIKDPQFTIVETARSAATGFSFPSGHTNTAVTYMGGLALWHKNNKINDIMKLNEYIEITNEDNMELMARYPNKYFDLAIIDKINMILLLLCQSIFVSLYQIKNI